MSLSVWRCSRSALGNCPGQAFYLDVAAAQPGSVFAGVTLGLAVLLALYMATLLYLPAVLVHFDLTPTIAWRVAALVAWRQPMHTVGMATAVGLLVVLMVFLVPAALPFYAVSLPAILTALRAFAEITAEPSP